MAKVEKQVSELAVVVKDADNDNRSVDALVQRKLRREERKKKRAAGQSLTNSTKIYKLVPYAEIVGDKKVVQSVLELLNATGEYEYTTR
jgi:hypothetical protein